MRMGSSWVVVALCLVVVACGGEAGTGTGTGSTGTGTGAGTGTGTGTGTATGTGTGTGSGTGTGTGTGTATGSGTSTTATKAEFAAAFADAICEAYQCYYAFAPSMCDRAGSVEEFEKATGSGRVTFDDVQARACVAAAAAAKGDGAKCWGPTPSPHAARVDAAMEACRKVLAGTVATGGACYATRECAAGWCNLANGVCPGLCTPPKANGAECDDDAECAPGSECLPGEDFTPLCTVVAPEGAACSESLPCAVGLQCAAGKCGKPAAVALGGTCIDYSNCGDAASCDYASDTATSGTCKALAAPGAACTSGGFIGPIMASPDCQGYMVCKGLQLDDEGEVVVPGRCSTISDEGGDCDAEATTGSLGTAGTDGCAFPLVCNPNGWKCTRPPPAGSPCIAGACGEGAYCKGGTCTALTPVGASCTKDEECEAGCSDATKKCNAPDPVCEAP
jgi:hypothetical protein